MTHRTMLFAVAVVSACLACAPQSAPPDTPAAHASLREADASYSQSGSSKDLATFISMYAADATAYVPDGPTIQGVDGIRAFISGVMQDPAFAISLSPVSIEVSTDGSLGFTINMATITSSGPDGAPTTERIRDLHVWRKELDEGWKLVVDLWNVESPAAAGDG